MMNSSKLRAISALGALAISAAAPAAAQLRIGPPVRTDAGPGFTVSNEISQASSSAFPSVGIHGYNDYRTGIRTWYTLTTDGGATWDEVLIRPPVPNQATVEGDPMACADPRTGLIWAGGIAFSGNGGMYTARYDPQTDTFTNSVMIQAASGTDKGWMAAGPAPNDPDSTRVYCAYNFGVARSSDLGDTWQGPVSLGSGIGFLPRVSADGTVHVAYYDFGTQHRLRSSSDGGVTWGSPIVIADRMDAWPIQDCPRIAGDFRAPSLQGLAVHPTDPNRLYFVFNDTTSITAGEADVDVYFTQSTDAGATWSTPVVINGDSPEIGDQWFPWIEVDEEGRLHATWYDSRHTVQNDADLINEFDAYYGLSTDDGASWTEARLTPSSFSSNDDGFGSGFIGDYIGMSVAGSRATPAYMRTDPVSGADAYVNNILVDESQEFCRGVVCPCGNTDPSGGCGNSGNDADPSTGATLASSGSASIAADDIVLTISGVNGGTVGLVAVGTDSGSTPVGDGQLCLAGTLARMPIYQADGTGTATVGPGAVISEVAASPIGAPTAGQTWYLQSFYRDIGGPCGTNFNFTNALSITWVP
jgi:hypothetical protein